MELHLSRPHAKMHINLNAFRYDDIIEDSHGNNIQGLIDFSWPGRSPPNSNCVLITGKQHEHVPLCVTILGDIWGWEPALLHVCHQYHLLEICCSRLFGHVSPLCSLHMQANGSRTQGISWSSR